MKISCNIVLGTFWELPEKILFDYGSDVKNLPAMQETQIQFLGWDDLLEEGMATHSSIFTWRILWTEKPGVLKFMGSQRVRDD